jgi:hypothetical protein
MHPISEDFAYESVVGFFVPGAVAVFVWMYQQQQSTAAAEDHGRGSAELGHHSGLSGRDQATL